MTFEDLKQNNLKMNGIPAWRNSLRQFCVHCSDDDGTRVDIGRVDAFARFHQRVVRWRGPQLVAGGWRRQGAGRGHRGGLVHRRVAGTPARRENGLSAITRINMTIKGGGIFIVILLAQYERLYLCISLSLHAPTDGVARIFSLTLMPRPGIELTLVPLQLSFVTLIQDSIDKFWT